MRNHQKVSLMPPMIKSIWQLKCCWRGWKMAVIFYRKIRWRPAYELRDNETGWVWYPSFPRYQTTASLHPATLRGIRNENELRNFVKNINSIDVTKWWAGDWQVLIKNWCLYCWTRNRPSFCNKWNYYDIVYYLTSNKCPSVIYWVSSCSCWGYRLLLSMLRANSVEQPYCFVVQFVRNISC